MIENYFLQLKAYFASYQTKRCFFLDDTTLAPPELQYVLYSNRHRRVTAAGSIRRRYCNSDM